MDMDAWEILKQAGELEQRGQEFALATVVWRQGPSSSQRGARAIITAEGELRGWIGGACAEPVVIREAQRVIADGTPRLLLLGSPDQFGAAVPGRAHHRSCPSPARARARWRSTSSRWWPRRTWSSWAARRWRTPWPTWPGR